eukprot:GHVQ01027993.1.p1 GENE.GHVQ01027993.1~~GHVQ01027993.1.p1  ORF type:complete len:184 (+),score=3.10 GHVQ01027993.1:210-761(+)
MPILEVRLGGNWSTDNEDIKVQIQNGVAYFFNISTGPDVTYRSAGTLMDLGICGELPRQSCPASFRASSLPAGVFVDPDTIFRMHCNCDGDWDNMNLEYMILRSLSDAARKELVVLAGEEITKSVTSESQLMGRHGDQMHASLLDFNIMGMLVIASLVLLMVIILPWWCSKAIKKANKRQKSI